MAIIKHGNNALSSVTAFPSAVPSGKPVLLSTSTASGASSIEITSGIDSTYDLYQFEFINISSSTGQNIQMYFSINGGSSYGVTKTTTTFVGEHSEDDSSVARIDYSEAYDRAQSTSPQIIFNINKGGLDTGSDASGSGSLLLFNPSSTTYVKHFIGRFNSMSEYPGSTDNYVAGYCNTTSAVNALKFDVVTSGTISGTIKMYGISA